MSCYYTPGENQDGGATFVPAPPFVYTTREPEAVPFTLSCIPGKRAPSSGRGADYSAYSPSQQVENARENKWTQVKHVSKKFVCRW